MTKPTIGHNNPPPDEFEPNTLYLGVDEDGQRTLQWGWELNPWRARPLPVRDRNGLLRPAREYVFERAVERMNKKIRQTNRRGRS